MDQSTEDSSNLEDKENQSAECVSDTAVTRRYKHKHPKTDNVSDSADDVIATSTPHKSKKHEKKKKGALQKLRDKLDMSMNNASASSRPGESNIQLVRQIGGVGSTEVFSPVTDKSKSVPHRRDDQSFDNVPHAHGHMSGSPYARRRVVDQSANQQRGQSSQHRDQSPYGGNKKPPVLNITRPPGKPQQGTQGKPKALKDQHTQIQGKQKSQIEHQGSQTQGKQKAQRDIQGTQTQGQQKARTERQETPQRGKTNTLQETPTQRHNNSIQGGQDVSSTPGDKQVQYSLVPPHSEKTLELLYNNSCMMQKSPICCLYLL